MQKKLIYMLATFFYSGIGKIAPGTMGTLATIPLAFVMLTFLPPLYYMILTFLLVLAAIFICQKYEALFGVHDDKHIVIDEVVGFLVTMTWLPVTWQSFLAGFVLFRLLDIWKPLFIRTVDKKIQGGLGVVADDLVAGVIANMALQWIYQNTNWLGASLIV